jgi:hypothetical protein
VRAALGLAAILLLAACQQQAEEPAPAATPQASPSANAEAAADAAMAGEMARQKRIHAAACKSEETPIFTCKFRDGKRVAVCGTAPGKAEYRFGGETPELVIKGGERAYTMYSGGGESQIAFTNGNTRYIVFSRMLRTGFGEEGNAPAISDGVVIDRAGNFVDMRICEDPDLLPVDTNAAETYLPADESTGDMSLFTEETMRADPVGNE